MHSSGEGCPLPVVAQLMVLASYFLVSSWAVRLRPSGVRQVRTRVRRRLPKSVSGSAAVRRRPARSVGVLLESVGVLLKSSRVLLKSVSSPGLLLLRLLQQHERPADERSEGRERRALGPTKNHDARRGDVRRQDRRADRRQVPEVA